MKGPVIFSSRATDGGDPADLPDRSDVERLRGKDERRVAAVHAGVFDVLADGPQDDLALVGDGVDLDLAGVNLELRDDDRIVRVDLRGA